jgi:hypothetical protein
MLQHRLQSKLDLFFKLSLGTWHSIAITLNRYVHLVVASSSTVHHGVPYKILIHRRRPHVAIEESSIHVLCTNVDVGDGDLALMGAPNAGGKLTAKPLRHFFYDT